MKYKIEAWPISKLLSEYDRKRLNLNPPYQRNDIWIEKTQRALIATIKSGMPIPNFFLHERQDGGYDIADGQQRTRALLQYRNGEITDGQQNFYGEREFLDFMLSIQIVDLSVSQDEIMKFYVKVNKAGSHLNTAELRKADNFESRLLPLFERLAKSVEFKSVEIFTPKQQGRMIDREFIEELAALLLFEEIQDKKESAIKRLYGSENEFSDAQLNEMEGEFKRILALVTRMSTYYDFSNSRYSQRNDFYTIFHFIHKQKGGSDDFFKKCFEILFKIAPDISPSNDKCEPFQDYALHCVSQSNSKKAREQRLYFFEALLLNESTVPNKIQQNILDYYNLNWGTSMRQNGIFFTLNPELISPKFHSEMT